MSLTSAQAAVRAFHQVMIGDAAAPETPALMSEYNGELRCDLIEEESREFRAAWEARDRVGMIDALCDLVYVTLGAAVQLGVDLEPFFSEVHAANMKKTGGSIREDGKQLKPEGWMPPDIAGVYRRLYGPLPEGDILQDGISDTSDAANSEAV
jgi:predicted HAD superfamily Cof-like phosphohydrolase